MVRFAEVASASQCSNVTLSTEVLGRTFTYEGGVFGWNGWLHRIHLDGLTAATWFCYQVGNANAKYGFTWSTEVFSFHTPPQPGAELEEPIVAAIYGDMGTFMPLGFRVTEQMLDDTADSRPFDAIVHVGDIAYAGTGEFCSHFDILASVREIESTVNCWSGTVTLKRFCFCVVLVCLL